MSPASVSVLSVNAGLEPAGFFIPPASVGRRSAAWPGGARHLGLIFWRFLDLLFTGDPAEQPPRAAAVQSSL